MKLHDPSVPVNWSGVGRVKISFSTSAVQTVLKVTVESKSYFHFCCLGCTSRKPFIVTHQRVAIFSNTKSSDVETLNDIQLMGRF